MKLIDVALTAACMVHDMEGCLRQSGRMFYNVLASFLSVDHFGFKFGFPGRAALNHPN
jgi:hypothetical protein